MGPADGVLGMPGKIDWRDYHQKRKHEHARFIEAAKAVAARVGPPRPETDPENRGRGRPGYSQTSMLLVNLLRIYMKRSYRDMEAYLVANPAVCRDLDLPSPPGRDTIHRHADGLSEGYLRRFNEALVAVQKKRVSMSVSMPRVYRSTSTRDVGGLPRMENASTPSSG